MAAASMALLLVAGVGQRGALAQSAPPPSTAPLSAAPAAGIPTTPGSSPAAEPASNPAAASECFPPCREGYFCHQSQCVSLCNPPCPSGQSCVAGRRCETPGPGGPGAIREPPPPPAPKPFDERGFFMAGFHYGFPGEAEVDPQTYGLGSTYGFNLRGDLPIERYLVLGPLFQFGSWRADFHPNHSSYYIDADLYARARLPITIQSTNLQIWVGAPLGLTFDIIGSAPTGVSSAAIGVNVGVLGGGAVHITPKLGLFTEFGWMMHKATHDAEPNVYLRLSQWVWNIGFALRE